MKKRGIPAGPNDPVPSLNTSFREMHEKRQAVEYAAVAAPAREPSLARRKIDTLLARWDREGPISDYEKIAIAKLVLGELSHDPLAAAVLKIL